MKPSAVLLMFMFAIILYACASAVENGMKLSSPAFQEGRGIPSWYTCDGENINPPLIFSDVPKNAKALALIMEDPDVPKSIRPDGMWDHWVVFNIPPEIAGMGENEQPPGVAGAGTRGSLKYGGPCPPDREHRYFFKLYALDALLDLPAGSNKQSLLQAMKGHVLAEATLMGKYERRMK